MMNGGAGEKAFLSIKFLFLLSSQSVANSCFDVREKYHANLNKKNHFND